MAKYCTNCGKELNENQAVCLNCGSMVENKKSSNPQGKSKLIAGLLGIFLGSLGIHNFYLGYNNKAIAQLLLTLVGWICCGIGPIAAAIWGLVEGILIFTGNINQDADGKPLGE